MKVKKIIIVLIIILALAGIIRLTYARYVIEDSIHVEILSPKYYFNVSADKTGLTESSNVVKITAKNFIDSNISNEDIAYNITIDNDKFDITIDTGNLTRVLNVDGQNEESDVFSLTFLPKSEVTLDSIENITISFNVTSPYIDTKELNITYEEEKQPLVLSALKETIVLDIGSTDYNEVIKNNLVVKDENGITISDAIKSYTLSSEININSVGTYTITYTASKDGYKTTTLETKPKLIISKAPSIDFNDTLSYVCSGTTINSQNLGIISLTSNNDDPQMRIPLDETEYFSPKVYKYAIIRYKVYPGTINAALSNIFALYVGVENADYLVSTQIETDGNWHEAILDLTSNTFVNALDYISWFRFDFINHSGVKMDIDYIKFIKSDQIEYAFNEDFTDSDPSNYNYTFSGIYVNEEGERAFAYTDGRLTIRAAETLPVDPNVTMKLSSNNYLDPKVYKFIYVRYIIADASSDVMQFYIMPESRNYIRRLCGKCCNTWM